MKKIINTILVLVITLSTKGLVFADGGSYNPYSPYNPYTPHVPVDTGLINDPIYFVGIVLLTAGFITLLNAKSLKSKLNLD